MKDFERNFSTFNENESVDAYEENDVEKAFSESFYNTGDEMNNDTEDDLDDDLPEIPDLEE